MASSFIDFKDYGFWGWDGAIEGWLYFLVQEIDKLESIPDWLREVRDHWYTQATVGFLGCIHPQLDEYLISEERVRLRSTYPEEPENGESLMTPATTTKR